MSTSLLYHAFGLVGYRYVRQTFQGGRVTFRIEQPRERLRCSACGDDDVWAQGASSAPSAPCPSAPSPSSVQLQGAARPVLRLRQDPPGQARASPTRKKHYTRAFERYALELSRHMTIQDVAEHLQVSWDTIKEIQARSLAAPLRQAQAAQAQADRHRRDRHRQGAPLPHRGAQPALRGRRLRRRRQGRRGPGAVLEAVAAGPGQGPGRGHRHVQGLHPRRAGQPAPGRARLRPLPRHQAVQRQAQRPAPRAVPPGQQRPRIARSSRGRAGCC